jgi:hypothetical protein
MADIILPEIPPVGGNVIPFKFSGRTSEKSESTPQANRPGDPAGIDVSNRPAGVAVFSASALAAAENQCGFVSFGNGLLYRLQ